MLFVYNKVEKLFGKYIKELYICIINKLEIMENLIEHIKEDFEVYKKFVYRRNQKVGRKSNLYLTDIEKIYKEYKEMLRLLEPELYCVIEEKRIVLT